MRWNDLETFVNRYDHTSTIQQHQSLYTSQSNNPIAQGLLHVSLEHPNSNNVVYHNMRDTDLFQLSVGKLMLAMQKRDRRNFEKEMENARKHVI